MQTKSLACMHTAPISWKWTIALLFGQERKTIRGANQCPVLSHSRRTNLGAFFLEWWCSLAFSKPVCVGVLEVKGRCVPPATEGATLCKHWALRKITEWNEFDWLAHCFLGYLFFLISD